MHKRLAALKKKRASEQLRFARVKVSNLRAKSLHNLKDQDAMIDDQNAMVRDRDLKTKTLLYDGATRFKKGFTVVKEHALFRQ
ncbi:hypothetical protein RIF29_35083 [Crotalaria pallida]|uniref:Uncharacterized protein n=1 Tax=Crotalaria pallida TaxID=3830 RepID=A0AAN9EA10_CROPI